MLSLFHTASGYDATAGADAIQRAVAEVVKATGFDGGARPRLPQPPESHERWLARRLRDRLADVGGSRFAS